MLPMLATAADTIPTIPVTNAPATIQLVSLTANVVETATPQANIQVDPSSPYLRAQASKLKAARVVTQAQAIVSPDPDDAAKQALAQQAAGAFGIDWKVLMAVWQVESGKQWATGERNSSGATGPCQFLPSTWRSYAIDGNGDGVKNIAQAQDCLYGAAKLLASNGAASGNVTKALLSYNHSLAYVNRVLGIANAI